MDVTYYVALPFVAADDGVAAGEAVECFNPNAAEGAPDPACAAPDEHRRIDAVGLRRQAARP
jgi:hypothetical protein